VGKKRFSCSWTYTWQILHKRQVFTVEEEGILHRLQSYTMFRNNTVTNFDTGFPMSKRDIANLICKSEKQTNRILKSLEKKNALKMSKRKNINQYVINPCLFWKGTEKDKEYLGLYAAFLKEIENMRCLPNCPCLVRVSGRVIPVWDMDVLQRGHGCPIREK